ncbi:histone acetyltransferase subunit NuA4-domain-containing protein [Coniochaeta sp. 2T2.1]|nr:histone acetyltransferase subunit NuA4-domain-containing protein [Coniochaeta sp. 2T2.1]
MTENGAPNGADGAGNNLGAAAGIPYYEKQRQHLKDMIARKRALEKRIAAQEEAIYQKETDYLESTPNGNIITGFDNYTKGTTGAAAQRRKTGLMDANRVFSRSSISYNPNAQPDSQPPTAASTPAAQHAPTPVSASFKDSAAASAAATPTSATASKAGKKMGKKVSAAAAAAAAALEEDSGTDTSRTKKARTNFGAGRK